MTVSSTQSRVVYAGNGSTTVFPFSFEIPASGDETIIYTDALGNSTTLANSLYAVSGFNNPSGGSVVYPLTGSPIAAGTSLSISRQLPIVQATPFANQGAYLPSATEQAFDYLTMIAQQISDELSRTLTGPLTDPTTISLVLPAALKRAGGYLGFDSNGNVTVFQGAAIDATTLNAFFASLPTTLPASAGVVWNNGGTICIS